MNTEFKAGALVAFGGYAQAIVYGMLAFAPLGQAGLAYGVYAGLASALLGGAVGAWLGKAPVQFGGPRSSTALIVAGSLAGFMTSTTQHAELMTLLIIELLLTGLLIVLAQRRGAGRLMQFLPAPVLIGMNTTLGLFSTYKLLPAMAGFAVYTTVVQAAQAPHGFSLLALAVSGLTVAVLLYFRAIAPNPLGLAYGLLAGLVAHVVLSICWPGTPFQTVNTLPVHPLWNSSLIEHVGNTFSLLVHSPALLLQVAVGAAVLASLIILESMQALLQVDQALGTRHNSQRELNAIATANLLCGLALALPSSNYFSRSNAALGVGSSSRRSEGWYAVTLLLLVLISWPVFHLLPLHVLATVVAVSSMFLIQGRTLLLLRQFSWPRTRQHMADTERFTVWVVLSMVVVTGLSNLLMGTLAGVMFVAAYFLQQQSVGGLRNIEVAPAARSRSLRPRAHRTQLDKAFEQTAWVKFEGSLFFGNAPAIAIRLQDELANSRFLLLDFTALRYIDDTACASLAQLLNRCFAHRTVVAVLPSPANAMGGEAQLEQLLRRGQLATARHIDDAFWQLENAMLQPASQGSSHASTVDTLIDSHLCDHMTPEQTQTLASHWQHVRLQAGATLFEQGSAACGLYVVHEGQLSAWLHTSHGKERLMRFCAGSTVGEMALIDRKPRSATVQADTPCTLLHLPTDQFDQLAREHTQLGQILQNNLARELTLRIRLTNQSLALLH